MHRTLLVLALSFQLLLSLPAAAQNTADEWTAAILKAYELSRQGRYEQAAVYAKRGLEIAERNHDPAHPNVAVSLNALGLAYRKQGQYAAAEQLHQRALSIYERVPGPERVELALTLSHLAVIFQEQARFAAAEEFFLRALGIYERIRGPEHPDVAGALANLANCYHREGKYAAAEPLYRRALAIREKALGPEHPDVADSLNKFAILQTLLGRYAAAESQFQRALAIYKKSLGPAHPTLSTCLNDLAGLYWEQARYADSERLYKEALAINEQALGPTHPYIAINLNNVAMAYYAQGQYAAAEPLMKRSLAIYEKSYGLNHPDVASGLTTLAGVYQRLGRPDAAEQLFQRALAIREKALGPHHSLLGYSLNNLAELYREQGRYADASPLYQRSLDILEKSFGPTHPNVSTLQSNLALSMYGQGDYASADLLLQRAVAATEQVRGTMHPDVAGSLNVLSMVHEAQGRSDSALNLARRVSSIFRQRIVAGAADLAAAREAVKYRVALQRHLALLFRNPLRDSEKKLVDESFQIVQLEQATGTSAALAKMALRFARRDNAIAALIQRKQDGQERRLKIDAALTRAASLPPGKRDTAAESRLRAESAQIERDAETADGELNARFPEYQALIRPEPLPVAQVQALLRPREAMLVYALGDKEGWLWVVRADKAEFISLPVASSALATDIKVLRAQTAVNPRGLLKVDFGRLHALYERIFAPALPHLNGVDHLLVVPTGPLQSLPFGMIVASPPPEMPTIADYAKVDWLIGHYALSMLPAVDSIRALRQFAQEARAPEPFIGFGDPLLTDVRERDPNAATESGPGQLFNAPSPSPIGAAGIANVALIKRQARLPDTADEIQALARITRAGPASVWLQERATESNVKAADLSRYRVVAFSTHGVMANQIGEGMEAGLLLTPPVQGSAEDDGYLSAGEIAQLKLNADLTVLSACDTAASDGTPGAEGLSGLAKAFFYAGSRSLLVSHWPVFSKASLALTTAMLDEYQRHPEQGKAAAHRKAALALMANPEHPEYAHPIFWAPFVVVGEGGAAGPVRKK